MQDGIMLFSIGFAAGIAVYRIIIGLILGTANPTVCDFCKEKRKTPHKR